MNKKILKRSLALGALMAFVITGNVWAAEIDYDNDVITEPVRQIDSTSTSTSVKGGAVDGWRSFDKPIKECHFINNGIEINNTIASGHGGAIAVTGDLEIIGGSFVNNKIEIIDINSKKKVYGGAISHQAGTLTINGTVFDNNSASGVNGSGDYGAAIYASSSTIEITDATFKNHKGTSDGMIYLYGGSKATLKGGNTFEKNSVACIKVQSGTTLTLEGINEFRENQNNSIFYGGNVIFSKDSNTYFKDNSSKYYDFAGGGNVVVDTGAYVESEQGINSWGNFVLNGELAIGGNNSTITNLSGTNGIIKYLDNININVTKNTTTGLSFHAVKDVNTAVGGDFKTVIGDNFAAKAVGQEVEFTMDAGDVVGDLKGTLIGTMKDGKIVYLVKEGSVDEKPHEGNAAISHNANIAFMAWRAETNDLNKRMGELRNSNGEYGVWVRMVGGEDEFKCVEYDYTQYQLGYDEKLSVDPSWTVGVALNYTDGESKFTDGSGENTHKGLSIYGSKLNDDGSFIDLIAKYSRLEHDLTSNGDKGDYSTNGYSVSAEYGKRFQQGKGLWIEPQVELTYGKVKDAEYKLGNKNVSQDAMESLVGRVGFSLGKDIKDGNVYARASYLYDFEGETNMAFTNVATRNFKYDLGGGWWEVGVGANINLSKATYIYADIEKTFGGEVDTNWQWNLGVRYSF